MLRTNYCNGLLDGAFMDELNQEYLKRGTGLAKKEIGKDLIPLFSRLSQFIRKYTFKYGLIQSNDLNEPLIFDFSEREEGFNDAMYR
ncbi:MAG: hypothetical protein HRT58_14770 [Crocinitomicaceae bacterium]|nr:hypothetical protein [Flavobacteriales bacterium]NQZ36931.1 hypothetical protein [Crocinitomicaceae bacterium]